MQALFIVSPYNQYRGPKFMNIMKDITNPILKLALPLILIQLCQASLGVINTMVAGRYHYLDLAGIGLGGNIWTPVFILFMGILYVLVPKISSIQQLNDPVQTHRLIQQGYKVALLLSVFGFFLIQSLAFLCPWLIDDPSVAMIAKNYLHFIAFAVPGLVYMILFRFISEGHSRLKPIMVTYILLLLCDASLCIALVNGFAGLPELGGAGTGLATAISSYIACFSMRYWVAKEVPALKASKHNLKVTMKEGMILFKEGLPIGITLVLQILALATLAFFASKLGTKSIAAHQIVINIAMLIVMIPIAISSATTIRIAHFAALKDQPAKMATSYSVAAFTLLYGLVVATVLTLFAPQITRLFSLDQEFIQIAVGLMSLLAVFLIFDAFQTVASGVLRGLQLFMQPLFVILFCYWIIILPLGYFMGVKGWMQAQANVEVIWMVLTGGIFIAAMMMLLLSYRYLIKPMTKVVVK